MLQKFITTGMLLSCLTYARAQEIAAVQTPAATTAAAPESEKPEEKKKFNLSGYADVYYRYDFNRQASNNKTSFTNSHNSFELGMISAKLEHDIGRVGIVADLGFGKRAEDFSYADDNTRFAIKQLFLTYTVGRFKLSAGSWATHVGYELVDPTGNRNYSMSYLFSYGPFSHTGVKAETTIGKNGFMLGIANPSDLRSTNMEHKYLIGQFSTATPNDEVKLYLNFQGGKPNDSTKSNQIDAVVIGTISEKFNIGLNGSIASYKNRLDGKFGDNNRWYGTAAYLNLDPKPWMGITLRGEYFNDEKQINVFGIAPKGGNVFATTLSFNFKVDNLTLIPELRFESASQPIFTKTSGALTDNSSSILLAAVYTF